MAPPKATVRAATTASPGTAPVSASTPEGISKRHHGSLGPVHPPDGEGLPFPGRPRDPRPQNPIDDDLSPGQLPAETIHVPLEIRVLKRPDSPAVKKSLVLFPLSHQDRRHRTTPGRQVPEKDQGISSVVSGPHQGGDLAPGVQPLKNQGGGAPGILHEGGLRNAQLLDGEPVELGAFRAGGGPDEGPPEGTVWKVRGRIHQVPPGWREDGTRQV